MKAHLRILSALLTVSMLCSLALPAAGAVDNSPAAVPDTGTAVSGQPETVSEVTQPELPLADDTDDGSTPPETPPANTTADEGNDPGKDSDNGGDGGNTENTTDSANFSGAKGRIDITLRLDFEQSDKALTDHNVTVSLIKDTGKDSDGKDIDVTPEDTIKPGQDDKRAKRRTGMESIDFIDMAFEGLEPGTYTVRFTGDGYKPYSETVELKDYNKYIAVGTGDTTFTLGDVRGDGDVKQSDRDGITEAMRLLATEPDKVEAEVRRIYDLNSDGEINIIDLAYVNHNIEARGTSVVQDTTPLWPNNFEVTVESASDIVIEGSKGDATGANAVTKMLQNSEPLQISRKSENDTVTEISKNSPVALTLDLASQKLETSQINILSPEGAGEIQSGTVTVEYVDENGNYAEVTVDEDGNIVPKTQMLRHSIKPLPEGIYAIGVNEGRKTITINLGKRVVVKRITIEVTKTTDNKFATVETIEFLKEIVPENPIPNNITVKGLSAIPGNESITLKWGPLPNIEEYKITYRESGSSTDHASSPVYTDKLTADISGLTNLKPYEFTVMPVTRLDNGEEWTGNPVQITATPQGNQPPAKVNMVNVTSGNALLNVSWKSGKNATSYSVWYGTDREKLDEFQNGGTTEGQENTSLQLTGLTNDTTYYIYVLAHNQFGTSPRSNLAEGTPKTLKDELPEGLKGKDLVPDANIESMVLADPGNVHPSVTSLYADGKFPPEKLHDGHYTIDSSWVAKNWSGNERIITTFKEPVDLSAVIWIPCYDDPYPKNLRAYNIRVWLEGDDLNGEGRLIIPDPANGGQDANGGTGGGDVHTWPNIPNVGSIPTDQFAILALPQPIKNIKKISAGVEQRAYTLTSCSELLFMKSDPNGLAERIDALFKEGTLHTELSDAARNDTGTAAAIDTMLTELEDSKQWYLSYNVMKDELNLAKELLNATADKLSDSVLLMNGVNVSRTPAENYQQGGSSLQALGAAAKANDKFTVYADIPEGGKLTIIASQFHAEASAWSRTIGTIDSGRSELTVPTIGSTSGGRGGSLYYTYSGPNPEKVRLHLRRVTDIPTLELFNWNKMTEEERKARIDEYLDELSAYQSTANVDSTVNPLNVTEISLPSVLLSIPATSVNGRTADQLYNAALAWDDVSHICLTTQGIDNTYDKYDMATRQNIRCMQMFEGAFMYAAGNHIGIGFGSCGGMTGGRPIKSLSEDATANTLYGWGISHEIGHNMDKLGKAEITNNIYSLMVQTYDGKNNTLTSRLEASGKYAKAFTKVAQGYPGASNDVFAQLCLYWQLHLAYDEGRGTDNSDITGPMHFYNTFFKAWKAGTYTAGASTYDDRFALTASGVAGKNLTEFCERWGMTLSQSTKDKLATYPAEERAIWYLDDNSRRDRLNGIGNAVGTVSVTAEMAPSSSKTDVTEDGIKDETSNTDVLLTISSETNGGRVHGFEIVRNGRPIDFVTAENGSATYTDVISTANHRTFSYSVIGYDSLGNKIGEAEAENEIRIAYDMVVDPSKYECTIENGTATITLTDETSVSGMRISGNWKNGGNYTVSITSAASEDSPAKTTEARTGSFTAEENQSVDSGADKFLVYFRKPGTTDTRIWTYDAKTVTITGIPDGVTAEQIELISYAGDDIAFYEDAAVGILSADYVYGDNPEDVIEEGTLIVVGTYRGDPVWNTIRAVGEFTVTSADESKAPTSAKRPIDGQVLLLAEIPEDGAVSDISDGIFFFIPNVQREKDLQGIIEDGTHSDCTGSNVLPSRMKLELYRTRTPESKDDLDRKTAETIWINTPGGDDIPYIVLESEVNN